MLNRISASAFAGIALLIGSFPVQAQNDPEGDIDQCRSLAAASRTRSNACGDDEPAVDSLSTELTLRLERPAFVSSQCQASMNIDYVQRGEFASVDGEIRNEDCPASAGEYVLRARIRDADGETQSLEFPQTWQRSDDQHVSFSRELPIGADAQLLNLRAQRLSCECAEPVEPEDP